MSHIYVVDIREPHLMQRSISAKRSSLMSQQFSYNELILKVRNVFQTSEFYENCYFYTFIWA